MKRSVHGDHSTVNRVFSIKHVKILVSSVTRNYTECFVTKRTARSSCFRLAFIVVAEPVCIL
jgi:hypothetical protein